MGDGRLGLLGWVYVTIIILASWVLFNHYYSFLIPSPQETLSYIGSLGWSVLARNIIRTLFNSLTGFTIALALGFMSLIAYYMNKHAKALIDALNTLVQSVSVLVWSLIFLLVFGVTSLLPPILVVTAASYPIVLSSMLGALKTLDVKYGELARSLGATPIQELRYFIIPGLLPYVVASSRAAIGVALRISVVAEAFGASGGVGYQLAYSFDLGIKDGVFAWALILVVLMITVDNIALKPLEGWSRRWML